LACCPDSPAIGLRLRLLGGVVGVLLLLLVWRPATAAAPLPDAQGVYLLDEAYAVLRADDRPVVAQSVLLPWRWGSHAPSAAGSATLTLTLPPMPDGERESQALLIEAVGNQVQLFVDGQPVDGWDAPHDPDFDTGRLPHLIALPAHGGARPPSGLRIELQFQRQRMGGLSRILYGPLRVLKPRYEQRRLWRNGAALIYTVGLLLMGGLSAGLWWHQRVPLYGCFSLAALSGTIRTLDQTGMPQPLPWPWWGVVMGMSYALHLALIIRFVLLALGAPPARLLRLQGIVLWLSPLLVLMSFVLHFYPLWTCALVLLCIAGAACLPALWRDAVVQRRRTSMALLIAGVLTLAAGVHDLLRVRIPAMTWEALTPHAMFGFVLILAGMVVERYSRSVREYRDLARSLDARVAERERQLTAAMHALQAEREQQAVLLERQRLMREIHDGVGSQLVGLLNLVGRPGADPALMEAQVKLALDELRVAVDSLQPLEGDLTVVLATLRYRLQPRLEAAGLTLEWEVDPLPPRADVTPQTAMQIQRILLEGFTNVLRHAQARRIRLEAHWHAGPPERMEIVLADDGRGFAADGPPAGGQGLASMRSRAAAIGATLAVVSAPGEGTALRVDWPMRR
jgi:signal transduction histidine kinase